MNMLWRLIALFTLLLTNGSNATPEMISAGSGDYPQQTLVLIYDNMDSIYVLGGHNGTALSNKIFRYSITDETLSHVATFPVGGIGAGAGFISGTALHYIGGAVANGTGPFASDIVWIMETNGDISDPVIYDHLTIPVYLPCISVSGTEVSIAGGWPTTDARLKLVVQTQPTTMKYNFSPDSKTSTTYNSTLAMSRVSGCCATSGDSIFFFAGISLVDTIPSNTIQKFSPPQAISTMASNITFYTAATYDNLVAAASVTASDGTIYVIGGLFQSTGNPTLPNFLSTLDPETGILTEVTVEGFTAPIIGCSAVLVANRIYIFGGSSFGSPQLTTNIFYIELDNLL